MSYFCIVNNFWIVVWFVSAKFCFSHIRKYSQQFSLITDKLIKWIKFIFGFLGLRQSQKLRFIDVCCSVAKSSPTLCNPMDCNMLGFPVLRYLPEFAQIHVHWINDAIKPSHPLPPLLLLLSIFSASGSFPVSQLHIMWPKFWSFIFSINPSNEYSGLISFRIDWFDLAVQGTLMGLLQHHNLKAPVLPLSFFFPSFMKK